MIKIEQFVATDATQMRALLRHQDELVPYDSFCAEDELRHSGYFFWQHWIPCRFHIAPDVYVAKENGILLGLISIAAYGKSRSCWTINHLVVHPNHRGRGIGQKLLQYVFALFGSQGVNHFVTEISCQNSPAMALLAGLGFRRATRLVHYQMPSEAHIRDDANNQEEENYNPANFRLAKPEDKQALCHLFEESLPADLRLVYDYKWEDFCIESLKGEEASINKKRLLKLKVWYWVAEDQERHVFTAAIKVISHGPGDYHLQFVIHPGWQHLISDTVSFAKYAIKNLQIKGVIFNKVYDYQGALGQELESAGWQRQGEFLLMVKEHWLRAKKRSLKLDTTVNLPSIVKPAINLPYKLPKQISLD